jgi:hypothetical protein
MRGVALIVGFAVAGLSSTGCESTQDKAAKLSEGSTEAFTQAGLQVAQENPDVKVTGTWALQDANGTAVGVRLKNTSQRRLAEVPIAIDVVDRAGKSLFRNDAPGLEPSLVGVALLRPGEELTWVNDQVVAAAEPADVEVKVGKEKRVLEREEPRVTLQQIEQVKDPSGTTVTGFVSNKSDIEQREIVIYAEARKSGDVVALGKAQVERVKPGKRTRFSVFFIGDPTGARVDLAVPATVTEEETK